MSYRIKPTDLHAVEPRQNQDFMNSFCGVIVGPLKDAIVSRTLFADVHKRLSAGNRITLYGFADADRKRLAEIAHLTLVEINPPDVNFRLDGKIVTVAGDPTDELTIEEVPHDYRVIENPPNENGVVEFRFTDGPDKTIDTLFTKAEADRVAEHYRKAEPDFAVKDRTGKLIAPPFRTRTEAEAFIALETGHRRKTSWAA